MDPICRVCLQEEGGDGVMVDILSDDEVIHQKNIRALLEECGNIKVEKDDPFPKYLCNKCSKHLLVAASFRLRCLWTQSVLQNNQPSNNVQHSVLQTQNENAEELWDVSISDDDIDWGVPLTGVDAAKPMVLQEDQLDQGQLLQDETEIATQIIQGSMMSEDHCDSDATDELPAQHEEQCEDGRATPCDVVVVAEEGIDMNTYLETSPQDQHGDRDQEISQPDAIALELAANENALVDEEIIEDVLGEEADASFMNKLLIFGNNSDNAAVRPEAQENADANAAQNADMPAADDAMAPSYHCDECGACFTNSNNMKRHIANMHGITNIFTCMKCCYHFTKVVSYSNHIKKGKCVAYNKHNTYKRAVNLPCPICGKSNSSSFSLQTHMRTHNGDRPFLCSFCEKRFKTKAHLMTHLRRHSTPNLSCSICDRKFFETSNLTAHMRTHTGDKPHACKICNKRFGRVCLLQTHLRTHSGEKPYACEVCNRAFAQSGDLKNHMTIHTGLRKYICAVCGRGYNKRSTLQRHQLTHGSPIDAEEVPPDADADATMLEPIFDADCFIEYAPGDENLPSALENGQSMEETPTPLLDAGEYIEASLSPRMEGNAYMATLPVLPMDEETNLILFSNQWVDQ